MKRGGSPLESNISNPLLYSPTDLSFDDPHSSSTEAPIPLTQEAPNEPIMVSLPIWYYTYPLNSTSMRPQIPPPEVYGIEIANDPSGSKSPSQADVETYKRVQYRIGSRDWKNLEKLSERLDNLKGDITFLHSFIEKKKNPCKSKRVNLADLDQEELKTKLDLMEKSCWSSTRHGHVFLSDPISKPFFRTGNGGRPAVYIKKHKHNTFSIILTSLVVYFRDAIRIKTM